MASRPRPTLVVVGATGGVGMVICELLSARRDIWGKVRLVASHRSVGRTAVVRGEELTVAALTPEAFEGADVALFNLPAEVAAHWAPLAAAGGTVVVDNSGAFRGDPSVPLVVPEINPERLRQLPRRIVANAACTTLAMILTVAPLHREYGLRELVIASYQAVSGVGRAGVETLYDQLSKLAGDRSLGSRPGDVRQVVGEDTGPFPAPLALNVIPWTGTAADHGWSTEELTLRHEAREILGRPDLKVSATCVRVPVVTGHSMAVHAVFGTEVDAADARDLLRQAPGVNLVDDPEAGEFPMPIDVVGTDPSWAGRVRRAVDDPRALDLFVTGDNRRKGAALNTVQLAELLAADLA